KHLAGAAGKPEAARPGAARCATLLHLQPLRLTLNLSGVASVTIEAVIPPNPAEYTMAFFTAASKADFQQQLQAALAQHVDETLLPQVRRFAEQFFGIVALSELTERRMSDLVGSTLASWRLLERFDPAAPKVHVFNPDYEKHGWQSTHSVLEVLHPDMPFLVD